MKMRKMVASTIPAPVIATWSNTAFPQAAAGANQSSNLERHDLAKRPKAPDAIEAVFIIQRAGNYYRVASFDFCPRGANSDYYMVVGRSKDILGPHVDKSGQSTLDGGGTCVLAADAGEPRWRGPGLIAILRDVAFV